MEYLKVADRLVGFINPVKNVFVTHRSPSHYFRKFDGFGLNEAVLRELLQRGVKEVWVFFRKEKSVTELWKARVFDWLSFSSVFEWKGNYGKHLHQQIVSERQLVLSKAHFEVV